MRETRKNIETEGSYERVRDNERQHEKGPIKSEREEERERA